MDDILEFEVLKKQYMELEDIEKDLFENAGFVLFSSEELKNRKVKKYNLDTNAYSLIYNALDNKLIRTNIYNKYDNIFNKYKEQDYTIVTYIGTISNWFDFGLVQKSLEELDNIVYFLVGPVEHNVEVIKHERIKYFGSIEHKYVKSLMLQSDVLVMPFKLNKLIEAVDPVKIYEYIALGKNILSVKYDELDKFSNYIHLYENYDEFKNILTNLDNSKNDKNINNTFAEQNCWNDRAEKIVKLIKDMA
jgi:glycosyltransferase involved in cell wall biosynthesis